MSLPAVIVDLVSISVHMAAAAVWSAPLQTVLTRVPRLLRLSLTHAVKLLRTDFADDYHRVIFSG